MPLPPLIVKHRIFVSYSHADHVSARELWKALEGLCQYRGDVGIFLDRYSIGGGDEWKAKILPALEEADVFLVLLSADFHASKFCMKTELLRMLERRQKDSKVRVIGVPLHDVDLAHFFAEVDGTKHSMAEPQCLPQAELKDGDATRWGLKPWSLWEADRKRDFWSHVVKQLSQALDGTATFAKGSTGLPRRDWLPHLCDRRGQEDAVALPAASWAVEGYRRPLVLMTQGRFQDCPSAWVKRLGRRELARTLGKEPEDFILSDPKPLAWPESALKKEADIRGFFLRGLSRLLGLPATATAAQVFQIYSQRGAMLLSLECPEGQPKASLALSVFLGLLAECPDLGEMNRMVVAINLQRGRETAAEGLSADNKALVRLLKSACDKGGICGAFLGVLPEINESDIEIWGQDEDVKNYLAGDLAILKHKHPLPLGKTWPMEQFAGWAANGSVLEARHL